MIRIAVVDHSAESRADIINRLNGFLLEAGNNLLLLPRISFKPICPQELRFNSAADLLIVGCEFIARDLTEISKIKKLFPNTPLLVWLNKEQSSLVTIEQLARQGADDVLAHDLTADYFFRRLLILVRKAVHQSSGKLLLVDGGKGGVGVTTIVAALAELLVSYNKKVAVVDLDFETQDLSRFLQARPFVNENLRLLLDEERPVSEETVAQCLNSVWQDDQNLLCMPPVLDTEDLYDPRASLAKTFLSVLEVLDSTNDLVIVDIGCARSSLQKMLYRVADKLLFVLNDDPASLYASVDKLNRARNYLGAGAQLTVLQNSLGLSGLGNKLLRKEFTKAAKLTQDEWAVQQINFCKTGQRWPGSGSTFYSQAKSQVARQLENLAYSMDLIQDTLQSGIFNEFIKKFQRTDSKNQQHPENKLIELDKDKSVILPILSTANAGIYNQSNPHRNLSQDSGLPAILEQEISLDSLVSRPRQVSAG